MKIQDIKYGLIAIDPTQDNADGYDILHFCGYAEQPGKIEADALRLELATDPKLGLTEVAGLEILPAPDWIVAAYTDIDQQSKV